MNDRDRAFLEDMAYLVSMNRVAAARALNHLWNDAREDAAWVVAALQTQGPIGALDAKAIEDARRIVSTRHDDVRCAAIAYAKLFVELMAGYEDLAAFCFAIDERNKPRGKSSEQNTTKVSAGLFGGYLDSTTGHVRTFVNQVRSLDLPTHPELSLADVLDLPPLDQIKSTLTQEQFNAVTEYYRDLPRNLHDIFGQFIEPLSYSLPQAVSPTTDTTAWKNDLNILMSILPAGTDPKPEVLLRAFHKLKHRFVITGNLPAYSGQSSGGSPVSEKVEYGRLPLRQERVDMFLQNIVATGKVMQGLASLLLILDEAGINL